MEPENNFDSFQSNSQLAGDDDSIDFVDLYSDLPTSVPHPQNVEVHQQLLNDYTELQSSYSQLQVQHAQLNVKYDSSVKKCATLIKNISTLFVTCQNELKKKDLLIDELTTQLKEMTNKRRRINNSISSESARTSFRQPG